jgi:glutathione S-transferase/RNA polymerase-associated protein
VALKLFEHPLSPYARKVKIALYEKGIPFQRLFVDPGVPHDDQVFQEFVISSPRREVPCLVDGDLRVFDSTVMLEYIEERWPKPEMMPDSAAERARVRMLEEVMDGQYEAVNWGLMEIRIFRRAEGQQAEALIARARARLERLWHRLERELEGREWMNGRRFGRGDAAVYPHLATSAWLGLTLGEGQRRLREWSERCARRESVAKDAAEAAESLRRDREGASAAGGRPRVRQYRDTRLEWMIANGGIGIVLEGIEKGTIRFAEEVA